MINDAMEAIHEVPRMLIDWERHDLAEVRMHLAGFRRLAGQEHRIWFCILTRD